MIETLSTNSVLWAETKPRLVGQTDGFKLVQANEPGYALRMIGLESLAGTLEKLQFDESSPWWQGLIVRGFHEGEIEPSPLIDGVLAGSAQSFDASGRLLGVSPNVARDLDLDLGAGVVGAAAMRVVFASVWQFSLANALSTDRRMFSGVGAGAAREEASDEEWLRPDSLESIGQSTIQLEDETWYEEDEMPHALALEDLDFRGGGLMGRRRSRG